MSESNSDLEYESADEETDPIVNSQIKKCDLTEEQNSVDFTSKDITTGAQHEGKEYSAPYQSTKKDLPVVDPRTEDTLQSEYSPEDNNDFYETELESERKKDTCCVVEARQDSPVRQSIESSESAKKCDNDTDDAKTKIEVDINKKHHEKQRVPLRLEKKMQQKSQTPKDASSENKQATFMESQVSERVPTEEKEKPKENIDTSSETKTSSWGFSSWGSNLLSTAASSVSTFTNQVSQGIGTVLETVESTLGAPAPEELAVTLSKDKESSNTVDDIKAEDQSVADKTKNVITEEPRSSILSDVSAWTKVLENTGSKVLMGGLDTLELIGKKTMDIITEGDPGLRNKRSVFGNGVTLSQILREAKVEADELKQDSDSQGIDTIHYSQLFDEYQGLVHLEALEMLSSQSQAKIQRLLMQVGRTAEVKKHLDEIKSIFENIPSLDDPLESEDFEDFDTMCKKHILELNLPFNVDNLQKTQERIHNVLKSYESCTTATSSPEEIYQSAICSLAEFTAKSIETFHKLAELILVQQNLQPNAEHFATNLTGLTTIMCIEINNLSSRYHRCLESVAEQSEDGNTQKTNVVTVVTNLYLEASNSNKYIQDAFLLLVPVLQATELESSS